MTAPAVQKAKGPVLGHVDTPRLLPGTSLAGASISDVARGWGELYADHGDFIWKCLRRMGLDPDESRDALHDVFLIVHRRLDSFDPDKGSERSWLLGIAANVARSERRRKRPIPVESLEPLMDRGTGSRHSEPPSASGEYRVGYLRLRGKIVEAVSSLEPERRVVFSMFELEGLSCLEIADELAVPVGTIYSRLHAARKQLQEALAAYKPEMTMSPAEKKS